MYDVDRAEDFMAQQEILITLMQNKMTDEHIIINKTAIQKRIEELEQIEQELIKTGLKFAVTRGKIDELISLLHQSTPLIPILEQAYFEGECYGIGTDACINKEDYISNLKLDI